MAGIIFAAFLILYVRTSAPSVLSGDSAEFQFAGPLLAVPHPTGYPLYTLLGYLASRLPGDSARRVTQISALCAALCVTALFLLARRINGSLAALVAALALALSPGLWNAATLAEVYALNALLIAALALSLVWALDRDLALDQRQGGSEGLGPSATRHSWLASSALVGLLCGLGSSHHSSFLFSAAPLAAVYGAGVAVRSRRPLPTALALVAGGSLGLSPLLYPLIQFARFGPFDGADHGLPRFYFWGAPRSWAEAVAHLGGGKLREGALATPSLSSLLATAHLLGERLWFEFGLFGLLLGVIGCFWLRRHALLWWGSLWVVAGSAIFLAFLGPSVQDAPVFTLPIMLPWALWVGCGTQSLTEAAGCLAERLPLPRLLLVGLALTLCLAATLAWGASRRPYADKSKLWLFRSYGEQVLAKLEPQAALITSWEQGTTLQYLVLVERQRPDVWVDIVEPGDESWALRAQRYRGRPVYFLGNASQFAGANARLVWAHDYASLYRTSRSVSQRTLRDVRLLRSCEKNDKGP